MLSVYKLSLLTHRGGFPLVRQQFVGRRSLASPGMLASADLHTFGQVNVMIIALLYDADRLPVNVSNPNYVNAGVVH